MTKINLLPPERIKEKRRPSERNYIWLIIVLPLIVVALMAFLYFQASSEVSKKEEALEAAEAELQDWQAKNAELKEYQARQEEIKSIEDVAVSALQGRIYWARILNNIAIMCPSDIWLTSLTGSAEEGAEGTVEFSGYALQCPNRDYCGYGIYPHYPDYRPIAGWLDQMAQIEEFDQIWLTSATPEFQGSVCTESCNPQVAPITGPVWYEDPECIGECTGTKNWEDRITCFLGEWVIQFDSSATLDLTAAVVGPPPEEPTEEETTPQTEPTEEEGTVGETPPEGETE